ncbi:uncharacterized protein LOC144751863 [Ciona intestinalis]
MADRCIKLPPSKIHFLHDSIGRNFKNGGSVNDCIYEIIEGRLEMSSFKKIIVKRDNLFWSLDNRRLYIFRVLEERGHIRTITAKLLPEFRFDEDKFTTTNSGVSVQLRGDKTFPHWTNVNDDDDTEDDDSDDDDTDDDNYYDYYYY